jgi:hypothetical protein
MNCSLQSELRQLAGRKDEVWGAESGADKLLVLKSRGASSQSLTEADDLDEILAWRKSRPPTGKSEKAQGFVQPMTALEHR